MPRTFMNYTIRVIWTLLIAAGVLVGQPRYSIRDLGSSQNGSWCSINASGQVAFSMKTTGGATHAARWNGSSVQDLGTLGGANSFAFGINALGRVVGRSERSGGPDHGFLWNGTALQDLETQTDVYSEAYAINDSGAIAGTRTIPGDGGSATVWTGGIAQTLPKPHDSSRAYGINNLGTVVGSVVPSIDEPTHQAAIWSGLSLRILGTSEGNFAYPFGSVAFGINNAGYVTGERSSPSYPNEAIVWNGTSIISLAVSPSGEEISGGRAINGAGHVVGSMWVAGLLAPHAFLWNGTSRIDLNQTLTNGAGWVLQDASGINDQGQICGFGFNSGQPHVYLLSPVSAPDPIRITTTELPYTACGDVQYQFTLKAEGGSGTYTWSIAGGLLPIGFELSPTGNITASRVACGGTFRALFRASDRSESAAFAEKELAISVVDPPRLLDPIPLPGASGTSLMDGSRVTTSTTRLSSSGRQVSGLAADGVSQVVVRIATDRVGEEVDVTVLGDGSVGSIEGSRQADLGTAVRVKAVATAMGPMAFAVYRSPKEFVQLPGHVFDKQRQVQLKVTARGGTPLQSSWFITAAIARPPLVLLHGLWSSSKEFGSLYALSEAGLFSVEAVNYADEVEVLSSTPPLPLTLFGASFGLVTPTGSSLGVRYGARVASASLRGSVIPYFKEVTGNPLGVPLAAVGVDIVAHSMGGLVGRAMSRREDYRVDVNFGRGDIHKMISIGTPHLGSPFAKQLLDASNSKLREVLAYAGNYSFDDCPNCVLAKPMNGELYRGSGAVGDLKGDGSGGDLSSTLKWLRDTKNSHGLPVAIISGSLTEGQASIALQSQIDLGVVVVGTTPIFVPKPKNMIQFFRVVCPDCPLSLALKTPQSFSAMMNGKSDGIVPFTSQTSGRSNGIVKEGLFHSSGAAQLYKLFDGEAPASLLDSVVLKDIVDLLNASHLGDKYAIE